MLDAKGKVRDDFRDVTELFDFVTEKKRTKKEVDDFVNDLAHGKYFLDCWDGRRGTLGGHNLRLKYKRFLRRNLARMISMYARLKEKRGEDGVEAPEI
jgi:hypothetical protein